MFQEWGFLLAEIWVLLALAALVGLIAGWLIWGGRGDVNADATEIRRLRAELDREKARGRALIADPLDDIPPMQGGGYVRPDLAKRPSAPLPTPAAPPVPATPIPVAAMASALDWNSPHTTSGIRPQGLGAARDGLADDLTRIKGIGPKMERLCNGLGFWHFDQIASWTADEVAWVDENLEGFKGRVSRDDWVEQASKLAMNQAPVFLRRKP